MATPEGLERFIEAQASNYDEALRELCDGRKRSHWMWYVFPQLAGLGHSAMAQFYAIADMDEAQHYLAHPLLGKRLLECVDALLPWGARRSSDEILGHVDALKLRSSLTLFERASIIIHTSPHPFDHALDLFFSGERDRHTLDLLG